MPLIIGIIAFFVIIAIVKSLLPAIIVAFAIIVIVLLVTDKDESKNDNIGDIDIVTHTSQSVAAHEYDIDFEYDDFDTAYFSAESTRALFLEWAKKGKTIGGKSSDYPRYLSVRVSNIINYHKSLLTEGYLKKPVLEDVLQSLKVAELKKILEENKLPSNGKKATLIERIIESAPTKVISNIMDKENKYVLSEKGQQYLNDNYDYIQLRKSNARISLKEYESEKANLPDNYNFFDIAWSILNKRTSLFSMNKDFEELQNNYMDMAYIMAQRGEEARALSFFLKAMYLCINTENNITQALQYSKSKKDFEKWYITPPFSNCAVYIYERVEYLTDEMIADCFALHTPAKLITLGDFKNIINDISEGETSDSLEDKYSGIIKKGYMSHWKK